MRSSTILFRRAIRFPGATRSIEPGTAPLPSHQFFKLTAPLSAVDHVLGPEHAPVTVVEYADFECPNCKQVAAAVKLLLERFAERVRFAFRHFPVEETHPHALMAAQAAECAGAQGPFWPMHDLLFENQLHLKTNQLHGYAERLRLDMARYTAEMDDQVYLQRIREHQQSGRDSGVRGTPTFFVNGKIQDVSFGIHALFDAVDALLKK
jgi:protein-disulfide isomerase